MKNLRFIILVFVLNISLANQNNKMFTGLIEKSENKAISFSDNVFKTKGISDSCLNWKESKGLVKFIRNNWYISAELSTTEVNIFNIKYKIGVQQLYSIVNFGLNELNTTEIYIGNGIGTNLNVLKNWYFNPELTSIMNFRRNEILPLSLGVNVTLLKNNLTLSLGPAISWKVNEFKKLNYSSKDDIVKDIKASSEFLSGVRFGIGWSFK